MLSAPNAPHAFAWRSPADNRTFVIHRGIFACLPWTVSLRNGQVTKLRSNFQTGSADQIWIKILFLNCLFITCKTYFGVLYSCKYEKTRKPSTVKLAACHPPAGMCISPVRVAQCILADVGFLTSLLNIENHSSFSDFWSCCTNFKNIFVSFFFIWQSCFRETVFPAVKYPFKDNCQGLTKGGPVKNVMQTTS